MSIPVRRQFSRGDPYWFDDYFLENHPSRRPLDQDFGSELEPDHFDQDEFLFPPPPSWFRQAMLSHFNNRSPSLLNRLGPGRLRRRGSIGGVGGPSLPSDVNFGRGRMQVALDVTVFGPENLNVKLVDNYLVIEGKHEERQEGVGFISRSFLRRYEVPTASPDFEVKPEDVNCTLNTNGILTVEVMLEPPVEEARGNEKVIPINITTTTSTSSKQFRHGHSSLHVKTAATEDAPAPASEFSTINGNQE